MTRIIELREQQARIHTNARAKLEEITDKTPEDRAGEINAEFDAMMADFDRLQGVIDREDRLARVQAALTAPDPRRPLARRHHPARTQPAAALRGPAAQVAARHGPGAR